VQCILHCGHYARDSHTRPSQIVQTGWLHPSCDWSVEGPPHAGSSPGHTRPSFHPAAAQQSLHWARHHWDQAQQCDFTLKLFSFDSQLHMCVCVCVCVCVCTRLLYRVSAFLSIFTDNTSPGGPLCWVTGSLIDISWRSHEGKRGRRAAVSRCIFKKGTAASAAAWRCGEEEEEEEEEGSGSVIHRDETKSRLSIDRFNVWSQVSSSSFFCCISYLFIDGGSYGGRGRGGGRAGTLWGVRLSSQCEAAWCVQPCSVCPCL